MSAEVWAFLTSAPFLTLLASMGVAVFGFFASRSTSRASVIEAGDKAMRTAYEVGDQLREELQEALRDTKAELKETKAELRAQQQQWVAQVRTLEQELATANARVATVERMRCPRIDCPVFIRPG